MSELNFLTIHEVKKGLGQKKFSAEEVMQSCLAQIGLVEEKVNAFLQLTEQASLFEQAQAVDKKIASGEELRPLDGIPIGLKDLFSTKDMPTTAGAKIIDNYIPPYDSTAVKRLKEAGAIIIGKMNQDAWGHGSSGENTDFTPARNPWDLSRVPGGSSSGSGAAVAAGECLAATGTDTGSSVRLPAAFCNLTGLKPTYGRVSRYGIIAMASSLDSIGHLTRDVRDSALVLSVTAGKDVLDATTSPKPVPNYVKELDEPLGGITIGVPKEYFPEELDPKIASVTQEAIKVFQKAGAKVKSVSLPYTKYAMACYYIIVPSEISSNLARFDGVRFGHERSQFGAEAKRRIMLGTYTLSAGYVDAYYKKAQKVRTLVKQDFEKALSEVDILLAPSSPSLPFKLGEKVDDPLEMYLSDIFMCPVNLAGIPSLNIPCGFVVGLPVGMQLIGPQFSESRLFQLGHSYQQLTDWHVRKPSLLQIKNQKSKIKDAKQK